MTRFESTPAMAQGKFVITLCSVATPITIPKPRSPQLNRFTFFLGQSLVDNRKRYTLYMGYFSTLAEADKWLAILRRIYPDAVVGEGSAAQTDSLSDTQVLSILEGRHAERVAMSADEAAARSISLLRPDDTSTRLALRDAVTRDAPVAFAVQLQWSAQPIELDKVPRHPIFRSYALYTTQARLEGQQWFCLRLGFFSDAISAKQVAQYLFAEFPSAAVVPVNPHEHATALETDKRSTGAAAYAPAPVGLAAAAPLPRDFRNGAMAPTQAKRVGTTLEDTLETLKTSGFTLDNDDESSATGVRHLQVVVESSTVRQSKDPRRHRRKM
jgi:hypothetical protein